MQTTIFEQHNSRLTTLDTVLPLPFLLSPPCSFRFYQVLEKLLKLVSSEALVEISVDLMCGNVVLRRGNRAEPALTRTRTPSTVPSGMAMCVISNTALFYSQRFPLSKSSISPHIQISTALPFRCLLWEPLQVLGASPKSDQIKRTLRSSVSLFI